MGIHSLTKLISQQSPNSIQHVNLFTLKGKRVAIDTSIFIYKSLINVRYNGDYLRNKNGEIMSHIYGLFNKIVLLKSYGIEPVFIFDGKPPEEKQAVLNSRNKKVKDYKDKISSTTDLKQKLKLEKNTVRITRQHIEDLEILFQKMGVSYIHAEGEAEAYAAELCRINYVYAVMSEDMDTLVYDCPVLIRTCIDKSLKKSDIVTTFNFKQIKQDMNLNINEFVDLCILCGCDYCTTIPKIGFNRAYNNIKLYRNIEKMIESGKFTIPDEFMNKYKSARTLFNIYKDKLDIDNIPIVNSNYDEDILREYLLDNCNMNKTKINNALHKLKPIV
jgi:flap endonuclease-1